MNLFSRIGSIVFIVVSLFFPTVVLAEPLFSVKNTGTAVTAQLQGVPIGDSSKIQLFYQQTPFPVVLPSTTPSQILGLYTITTQTISWTIPSGTLKEKTKYYIRAEGSLEGKPYLSTPLEVTTGEEIQADKIVYEEPSSDYKSIYITSAVKNSNRSSYNIILEYQNQDEKNLKEKPREARPEHGRGADAKPGIASDGTYLFHLTNLTQATKYYVTHRITSPTGAVYIEEGYFDSKKGHIAIGSSAEKDDFNKRSYRFLSDLSGKTILPDRDLCLEQAGTDTVKQAACNNQIGNFIDLALKVLIGIAAVILVVQIILKGYQYMTTDVPFMKAGSKERIREAAGGLLLALSSYLILNTINPRLLHTTLNVGNLDLGVEVFEFSGGATVDGKPIKVDLKKTAYPAAKIASEKTGVDTAFILAMFAQESSSGQNSGTCNYTNANMGQGQLAALQKVATLLKLDYRKINMSCSGGGSSHGGAIGYTQFLPGTWLEHNNEARRYLNHEPYPWDTADALMMTGVFLKNKGGAGSNTSNQEAAACKYFGSCGVLVTCGSTKKTYGQCVLAKKLSIQKQIDEAKAKGEIK
jgi:hypothetical protein